MDMEVKIEGEEITTPTPPVQGWFKARYCNKFDRVIYIDTYTSRYIVLGSGETVQVYKNLRTINELYKDLIPITQFRLKVK